VKTVGGMLLSQQQCVDFLMRKLQANA